MRRLLPLLLLGLASAAVARDNPQAKLDRALAGKVEGPSVSCISLRRNSDSTVIDENTIIYRENASRVYVNHPSGGCAGLGPFTAIVTRTPSDQLCRGDIAQLIDTSTRMSRGSCIFGDFIPYSRPKR